MDLGSQLLAGLLGGVHGIYADLGSDCKSFSTASLFFSFLFFVNLTGHFYHRPAISDYSSGSDMHLVSVTHRSERMRLSVAHH